MWYTLKPTVTQPNCKYKLQQSEGTSKSIASRVQLSCQNSKDQVEQSDIVSSSTDDFPNQY